MHVMDAGSKPDHLPVIDRDGQVMPVVAKELGHESGIEIVVKDSGRDGVEDRVISGRQDPGLHCTL